MDLKPVIIKYADKYKLPANIIYGICMQESGMNQYAVRYEPNYKYLFMPEKTKPKTCSTDTETILQKISFGLGQIMGAVLRERGYKDWLTKILNSPDEQIDYMCKHLSIYYKKYNNINDMISSYNQGSPRKTNSKYNNQYYVDKVLEYSKQF